MVVQSIASGGLLGRGASGLHFGLEFCLQIDDGGEGRVHVVGGLGQVLVLDGTPHGLDGLGDGGDGGGDGFCEIQSQLLGVGLGLSCDGDDGPYVEVEVGAAAADLGDLGGGEFPVEVPEGVVGEVAEEAELRVEGHGGLELDEGLLDVAALVVAERVLDSGEDGLEAGSRFVDRHGHDAPPCRGYFLFLSVLICSRMSRTSWTRVSSNLTLGLRFWAMALLRLPWLSIHLSTASEDLEMSCLNAWRCSSSVPRADS